MVPDNSMADDPEGDVDPLARLRVADPADPDVIAALSTSARARALRAEIAMQTEPTPTTSSTPRWQRPVLAGVAVVLLGVAGTAVVLGLAGGEQGRRDLVAEGERVDPEAVDGDLPDDTTADDPMVDTDVPTGMALCAFASTPETLVQREVAFVGTVTAIDGDAITFDVEEVFTGDLGATATLGGGEFLAIPNPDNVNPVTVGERFLVAGDDGFAWGCGFTHLYDEDVAATWRAAFAG